MDYIASIITIVITAFIMVMFQIILHPQKPIPVVEFYPPYQLDPIEVAAHYYGKIKAKHLGAYFFYWAEKGFVRIENDVKKNLVLYKLQNIITDNTYEADYFNVIFSKGKCFKTIDFYNMGMDFSSRLQNAMFNLIHYNRDKITTFPSYLGACRRIYACLGMLPLIAYFIDICILRDDFSFMMILIFPTFMLFIWEIGYAMAKTDRGALTIKWFVSFIFLVFFLAFFFMEMETEYLSILNKVFVVISLVFFFTARMTDGYLRKHTKISYIFQCKIEGFKFYLEHVEEDKLNALVADDPNYFRNIMAYCYILEISNEIVKNYGNVYINVGDLEKNYNSVFTLVKFNFARLLRAKK